MLQMYSGFASYLYQIDVKHVRLYGFTSWPNVSVKYSLLIDPQFYFLQTENKHFQYSIAKVFRNL